MTMLLWKKSTTFKVEGLFKTHSLGFKIPIYELYDKSFPEWVRKL